MRRRTELVHAGIVFKVFRRILGFLPQGSTVKPKMLLVLSKPRQKTCEI
jgi:hypothetical protein